MPSQQASLSRLLISAALLHQQPHSPTAPQPARQAHASTHPPIPPATPSHPPSKREKSSSSPSTARQAASTVRRPSATPAFRVGTSMHRGLKLQAGGQEEASVRQGGKAADGLLRV